MEYGMGMNDMQYQLLYSIYSFPNIILPLFGGYFIDKLGKRTGIVIFACVVAIGQFIFAVSTHAAQGSEGFGKFLMIFGRFIFGLGGENLAVTESAFIASWFKGKELSLALGVDLCVSKLATAINDDTQPAFYIASGNHLSLGYWFGFILCLLSIGAAYVLIIVDTRAENSLKNLQATSSQGQPADNNVAIPSQSIDTDDEPIEPIRWNDFRKFPTQFWILSCNCLFMYMCFMSFMNVGSDFLRTRFNMSIQEAGVVLSLPYTLAAIISPFAGYFIDLIGMRTQFSTISILK